MDAVELKVCFADFGLACKVDDRDALRNKCGTPGYVAPEILQGAPFSTKSDIFSLGSVFYSLLTG